MTFVEWVVEVAQFGAVLGLYLFFLHHILTRHK